ncbi:hypothetical protein SPBR_09233 [Sporothrix brasiliensis 5110]|uniref:Uncharacterized protein n=1 Tax=Sporothrix brasiliensis 5110 TaxID=1398154 RepID=A0A0C2F7M7_9PEZI|nr:uncharacterized protein SPBR_09233 [Sporothrix brasiliensis 5110]KIH95009.1 hypothetical protein SPBR_09233 [Sporothrix brasiliensis 5110]
MATIALTRPMPPHRASSSMPPLSSSINIDVDTLNGQAAQPNPLPAGPVPNKHIPVCPPGPPVVSTTPSPSPPPDESSPYRQSLLFPPDHYPRFENDGLAIYDIDPTGVAAAVDYIARQPLPDPSLVFPWFHGLHPVNHMQQAFFFQRRRVMRKTPCCLRGLTIVKADGQLQVARLKGAIAPGEFLQPGTAAEFLDPDPKEGFSVRNFQIQAAKTAMTSDIIVYGDDSAAVRKLAWRIAAAQKTWRDKHDIEGIALPRYNTFACTGDFSIFEEFYPHIVSADSEGHITGNVIDFFHQERSEMYAMTVASEISHNVWLGPTPEPNSEEETSYDVLIECSDLGHLNPRALRALAETGIPSGKRIHLDFPSSGTILPPTWSQIEADAILESCKWIYHLAHGTANPSLFAALTDVSNAPVDDGHDITLADEAEESPAIAATQPKKILIHCADGYTESTSLQNQPKWFSALDGSFPSRVLDYMYLGNLNHANNPDLLKALGITQILSVGEMAMWRDDDLEAWGEENPHLRFAYELLKWEEMLRQNQMIGDTTAHSCKAGIRRELEWGEIAREVALMNQPYVR